MAFIGGELVQAAGPGVHPVGRNFLLVAGQIIHFFFGVNFDEATAVFQVMVKDKPIKKAERFWLAHLLGIGSVVIVVPVNGEAQGKRFGKAFIASKGQQVAPDKVGGALHQAVLFFDFLVFFHVAFFVFQATAAVAKVVSSGFIHVSPSNSARMGKSSVSCEIV